MQASREQLVKVIRRPYITRSHLVEGRFNAILKLEAEVPSNSYIFTWIGEPKQISLEPLVKGIKRMAESGEVTPQRLETLYRSTMEAKRMRGLEGEKKLPSYNGVKYIPGSSIKGSLRARIEYKFAPKLVSGGYMSRACYIIQGDAGRGRHVDFWGMDENYRREKLCSGEDGEVCIVCDLFGTPSLSSRVQVSDALLRKGEIEELPDLGLEAFKPESMFNIEVSTLNFNLAELGLILLGFEIPNNSPILIGFKKYFYNPKVGGQYKNKYYFGLLKVNLINLETFDSKLKKTIWNPKEALEICLNELKNSEYNEWLDYKRGVINI